MAHLVLPTYMGEQETRKPRLPALVPALCSTQLQLLWESGEWASRQIESLSHSLSLSFSLLQVFQELRVNCHSLSLAIVRAQDLCPRHFLLGIVPFFYHQQVQEHLQPKGSLQGRLPTVCIVCWAGSVSFSEGHKTGVPSRVRVRTDMREIIQRTEREKKERWRNEIKR